MCARGGSIVSAFLLPSVSMMRMAPPPRLAKIARVRTQPRLLAVGNSKIRETELLDGSEAASASDQPVESDMASMEVDSRPALVMRTDDQREARRASPYGSPNNSPHHSRRPSKSENPMLAEPTNDQGPPPVDCPICQLPMTDPSVGGGWYKRLQASIPAPRG